MSSEGANRFTMGKAVGAELMYSFNDRDPDITDRIWDFFMEPTIETAKLLHDELSEIYKDLV